MRKDWPPDRLLQAKGQTTVSVVMPARNEEATVGTIATVIRSALIQAVPLVDEIIVVDSRSVDGTAAAARAAGAFVVSQDDITLWPAADARQGRRDVGRAGRGLR